MTIATFGIGLAVKLGFADDTHAVVATTAFTNGLVMIDDVDYFKAKGGMTGLTNITGRQVIR